MKIDLITSFSVINKTDVSDGVELFSRLMLPEEVILLSYKHVRDRVVFTNKKIIAMDSQGLTGKKKEFRMFPYSKISSYSVETAGTFDGDSDFKIWVSGVGVFEIKFAKKIDIHEVGALLAEKVG